MFYLTVRNASGLALLSKNPDEMSDHEYEMTFNRCM